MTNIEILKQAIALDKKLALLDKRVEKAKKEFTLVQSERDKLRLEGDAFDLWNPNRGNKFTKIGSKLFIVMTGQNGSFQIDEIKVEKL